MKNLVQLYNDINDRSYKIGQSMAFIVNKPVKREIFAADFRDRIVHHWLISKLNPILRKNLLMIAMLAELEKELTLG